jgi:hypothetical protein
MGGSTTLFHPSGLSWRLFGFPGWDLGHDNSSETRQTCMAFSCLGLASNLPGFPFLEQEEREITYFLVSLQTQLFKMHLI